GIAGVEEEVGQVRRQPEAGSPIVVEEPVGVGGPAPDDHIARLVAQALRQRLRGDPGPGLVDRLEEPGLPADDGDPCALEAMHEAEELPELLVPCRRGHPGYRRRRSAGGPAGCDTTISRRSYSSRPTLTSSDTPRALTKAGIVFEWPTTSTRSAAR